MIVVPDVHGRKFWKEVLNHDDEIVFLGDYLDPYPIEDISDEDTIKNFEEILAFKKANPDRVTLLLGNHDFGYISNKMLTCRKDFDNEKYIKDIFEKNKDLFKIGLYKEFNNRIYTFTHSAIIKSWVELNNELNEFTNPCEIIDFLNDLYINDINTLLNLLNQVSYRRGGWDMTASCIWADIRDILEKDNMFVDYYAVFGHTQLKTFFIDKDFACLDCRKCFKISDNGQIFEL